MRSHYPMLSVVAALFALAVPTILIAWPFSSQPQVASAGLDAPSESDLQAELRRLGQSLVELRNRIDELERPQVETNQVASKPLESPHPPAPVNARPTPPPSFTSNHSPGSVPLSLLSDDDRSSASSISIPYPSVASLGTIEIPAAAISVISQRTPLPLANDALLMAAKPSVTDEATPTPAATGALFAAPHALSSGTLPPPPVPPVPVPVDDAPRSRVGQQRTTRRPDPRTTNSRPMGQPSVNMPPEFAGLGPNPLEDWVDQPSFSLSITRPSTGLVRHWEEFVATTSVPGWPVVMVRSETEGDHWWVQQLVARRGNVIAAKVSFGNEETIAGHRFDVVVLLLESSAESVRFRTARKFKELPDGVKRSVVYRYVRR